MATTVNNFGNYQVSDPKTGMATETFRAWIRSMNTRTGGSISSLVITDVDVAVTNLAAQVANLAAQVNAAEQFAETLPVTVFANPAPDTGAV